MTLSFIIPHALHMYKRAVKINIVFFLYISCLCSINIYIYISTTLQKKESSTIQPKYFVQATERVFSTP